MFLYRTAHKETDSLSVRLIKDWIHSTRAMLVKQRLDKPMAMIDESLVQVITPVGLEEIDSSTFELEGADRKVIRTKINIPPTINRRGLVGTFSRIGPVDRLSTRYKVVTHETALISGYGKFNRRDIYAFPLDNKIYLLAKDIDPTGLLDIRGVFQNPETVPIIKLDDEGNVTYLPFDHDGPYPINRELIDTMEEMVVKTKFPSTIVGYQDTQANEADDIVQTTAPAQRERRR